ncbi:MAG: DUF4465 domain-containing protein, partial [Bacteroidota bacterium]
MKLFYSLFYVFLFVGGVSGQIISDFENFNLAPNAFLNGSQGEQRFISGDVELPNTFTDFGTFQAWSGWSISTVQDTLTAGLGNQYASWAGAGHNGSATYAVTSAFSGSILRFPNGASGTVNGFYISNATYAAYSMLE